MSDVWDLCDVLYLSVLVSLSTFYFSSCLPHSLLHPHTLTFYVLFTHDANLKKKVIYNLLRLFLCAKSSATPLLNNHFHSQWLNSLTESAPKMWVLKLLRFLMRPPSSIISEKMTLHANIIHFDWIVAIMVELSGTLQQHSGNWRSAGSVILFTALWLLASVLLLQGCRDELWGNEFLHSEL